jgi:hypothetical protein
VNRSNFYSRCHKSCCEPNNVVVQLERLLGLVAAEHSVPILCILLRADPAGRMVSGFVSMIATKFGGAGGKVLRRLTVVRRPRTTLKSIACPVPPKETPSMQYGGCNPKCHFDVASSSAKAYQLACEKTDNCALTNSRYFCCCWWPHLLMSPEPRRGSHCGDEPQIHLSDWPWSWAPCLCRNPAQYE